MDDNDLHGVRWVNVEQTGCGFKSQGSIVCNSRIFHFRKSFISGFVMIFGHVAHNCENEFCFCGFDCLCNLVLSPCSSDVLQDLMMQVFSLLFIFWRKYVFGKIIILCLCALKFVFCLHFWFHFYRRCLFCHVYRSRHRSDSIHGFIKEAIQREGLKLHH